MKLKQHPAFPEIWVTPDGRVFAELLAASWRRAGSVAHVVARFV